MVLVVGNPDANGNVQNGRDAYAAGRRTPERVLRAHLRWNRGAAADQHFCSGYREAATADGASREHIAHALRFLPIWRGALPLDEQIQILEIICNVQRKQYANREAPAQWQLDRARAARSQLQVS